MSIAFTKVAKPYGWLGNMAPFPLEADGLLWRTSEALFQARRFASDDPIREAIRSEKSPMAAKMIAKSHRSAMVIVPQSKEDIALMLSVLNTKLATHPQLTRLLTATGDEEIIEDCTKRPHGSGAFWGAVLQADGTWLGSNWLGRLWMQLREEVRVNREDCK